MTLICEDKQTSSSALRKLHSGALTKDCFKVSYLTMSRLLKPARLVVVLLLSVCLLRYFLASLHKYRSGRIGLTTEVESVSSSKLPAVMVCSAAGRAFGPVSHFRPWIRRVRHQYLDEQESIRV